MSQQPSVGSLLAEGRSAGLSRLDRQLLLAHVLGRSRTWLLAHDDAFVEDSLVESWRALVARCAAGEPLAYLVGCKEFRGLPLSVDARVLVPRPETELLVELAVELWQSGLIGEAPRLLDLGAGSGAIALACKQALPAAQVFASDLSEAALSVARSNGERLGLDVTWRRGSWFEPWRGERFDLVVSNPPYVAARDPHLVDLRHEPIGALVAGVDGLDAIRTIAKAAPDFLRPGGALWVEHGFDQGEAVRALLLHAGFAEVQSRRDLAGHDRCSGGRLPGDVGSPGSPLIRVEKSPNVP